MVIALVKECSKGAARLSIATLLSLALRQGRACTHQEMIKALLGKSTLYPRILDELFHG